VPKEPKGRRWSKYSPEFKEGAVARIAGGESPTAVARELGIRRKFLYAWKAAGWGAGGDAGRPVTVEPDREQREIGELQELQQRIVELERLTGRQAAELDFFGAALRSIKETRQNNGVSTGERSTK
jgi:transposase-like protein